MTLLNALVFQKERFCRRPTLLAVGAFAFAAIEGGGVEPGDLGQPRRREVMTFGERVDSAPDLRVGQHRVTIVPRM